MTYQNDSRNLHGECEKYMYHHVVLTLADGNSVDGIIENVSGDRITVLVGEDVLERENDEFELEERYYGYGGRPRRRFRRFRRQVLPLALLASLSLLPYAYPYPYYPPYYPYY